MTLPQARRTLHRCRAHAVIVTVTGACCSVNNLRQLHRFLLLHQAVRPPLRVNVVPIALPHGKRAAPACLDVV